jgi:hypothetical protein
LVSILSPHHRRILPIPFDQESSFSDSLKCFFDSIGAQVRQQVIATLGRVEELRESGQLERLLRSGARFAVKEIVVDALNDGTAISADVRRVGPALVFERLWDETGCRAVIEQRGRTQAWVCSQTRRLPHRAASQAWPVRDRVTILKQKTDQRACLEFPAARGSGRLGCRRLGKKVSEKK